MPILSEIRSMLRAFGVPMALFSGPEEVYELPAGVSPALLGRLNDPDLANWRLVEGDAALHSGRLADAEELLLWAEAKVRQLLAVHYPQRSTPAEPEEAAMASLLRGCLVECLIGEHLPERTVSPTLTLQFEGRMGVLPTEERQPLASTYACGDLRGCLLHLSARLLGEDGRTLVERLGLTLPRSIPKVTPDWVKLHQRRDRPLEYWFYHSPLGTGLFLVLYTRRCGYRQCSGCNLPQLGSEIPISPIDVIAQLEQLLSHDLTSTEKDEVRELILSNNGSLFDPQGMPLAALLYACVRCTDGCRKLRRITFESRAEFVTTERLAAVVEAVTQVRPEVEVEIAVGVEVFEESSRNREFRKGISNRALEALAGVVREAGASLRLYFMYRPLPGWDRERSDEDIRAGAAFLAGLSHRHGIAITMHINPTYAALNTPLATAFAEGRFTPPRLSQVAELLKGLPTVDGLTYFVGLNDEGLAVPGGSFIAPGDEALLAKLRRFNRTRDRGSLR